MLLERIIHILLNGLAICENIVINFLLNEPAEEV